MQREGLVCAGALRLGMLQLPGAKHNAVGWQHRHCGRGWPVHTGHPQLSAVEGLNAMEGLGAVEGLNAVEHRTMSPQRPKPRLTLRTSFTLSYVTCTVSSAQQRDSVLLARVSRALLNVAVCSCWPNSAGRSVAQRYWSSMSQEQFAYDMRELSLCTAVRIERMQCILQPLT
jgi:hypothetical protein